MKRLTILAISATTFFFLMTVVSSAITIEYALTHLGGNSYEYLYSISNDGSLGASTPLQIFDIAFDPALYEESSLAILSPTDTSDNWLEELFASAVGVPAFFNALALTGGIPVGDTVSGFTVSFDWLGGAAGPGAQIFEVYDPQTFDLLVTGTTRNANDPTAVPEPATLLLVGAGLAGIIVLRKRSSKEP